MARRNGIGVRGRQDPTCPTKILFDAGCQTLKKQIKKKMLRLNYGNQTEGYRKGLFRIFIVDRRLLTRQGGVVCRRARVKKIFEMVDHIWKQADRHDFLCKEGQDLRDAAMKGWFLCAVLICSLKNQQDPRRRKIFKQCQLYRIRVKVVAGTKK